jgi:hypothetical protein
MTSPQAVELFRFAATLIRAPEKEVRNMSAEYADSLLLVMTTAVAACGLVRCAELSGKAASKDDAAACETVRDVFSNMNAAMSLLLKLMPKLKGGDNE